MISGGSPGPHRLACFVLAGALAALCLLLPSGVWAQFESAWEDDADARVLADSHTVDIYGQQRIVYRVHRVVDIHNKAGAAWSVIQAYSSQYVKLKRFDVAVYDGAGKVLNQFKLKDVQTASMESAAVIYNDLKVHWMDVARKAYPYRVAYTIEQEMSSLFFWPDWSPQQDVPVLKSTYTLTFHKPVGFRHSQRGLTEKPTLTTSGGKKTLIWSLEKLQAVEPLMYCPPEWASPIYLHFAPRRFVLGHSFCNAESWQSLGAWYGDLARGRYRLPPEASAEIDALCLSGLSERARTAEIYAWLQRKTRYAAIELGMQGWQPHAASLVYQNCYGDCKGLTTLMVSALNYAGIEAYPVLIKTRSNGVVDPAVIEDNFNHVMALALAGGDSLWLECTADLLPAGELPYQDEGCHVLLVKDDGGHLAHTPLSAADENRWGSRISGRLTAGGQLALEGRLSLAGNQANWLRWRLNGKSNKERQRWMNTVLRKHHPTVRLDSLRLSHVDTPFAAPVAIAFSATYSKFIRGRASRLFIKPSFFNRKDADDIPREKERDIPIYHGYRYADCDTVELEIPEGYVLEAAPAPLELNESFGRFTGRHVLKEGRLFFVRSFRYTQRLIPQAQYEQYLAFLREVARYDRSAFVFKKVGRP